MKTVALMLLLAPPLLADPGPEARRVLFLTHSAGFQHGVVNRKGAPLALAETLRRGLDVRLSKPNWMLAPFSATSVQRCTSA